MSIWYWFLQLLGLAGTLTFAWGCVPTAWRTWKAGKSVGTPVGLAWNILIACLLFYTYTLLSYGLNPLIAICGLVEILAYAVVIWYEYLPRLKPYDSVLDCYDCFMERHHGHGNWCPAHAPETVAKILDPKPLKDAYIKLGQDP